MDAIEDDDHLVELVCEFASRVADDTDDPAQMRKLLDTVSHKVWQKEPWRIVEAALAVSDWAESPEEGGAYAAGYAISKAITAAWRAQSAERARNGTPVSYWACKAAWYAQYAANDPEAEKAWQLGRLRERMICTCPDPLEAARLENRSRVSLLAD
jgi:hypothetical protein